MTLLSALVMAAGIMPFYWLGVLGPLIVQDYALPPATIGMGLTAVAVFGMLCRPLSARLAARSSLGRGLAAIPFVAAASGIIASLAVPPAVFCLSLIPAGFAVAAANPITNVAIQREGPRAVGLRIGFKQSGVQAAQFVVGATFPAIAVVAGWALTLRAAGAFFAVAGVLILVLLKEAAVGRQPRAATPHLPRATPLP
ncbi:MAG: MFS transporter [Actinobacteria bacterium]|nr:MFS transporter [Actinomycetota bacterium]